MRLALARDGERFPEDLLRLLEAAGLPVAQLRATAHPALLVGGDVEWLVTAGSDVLTVCMLGGADAGIVRKEALVEADCDLVELLDLGTGRRRLVFAAPPSTTSRRRLRVASRYPRTALSHLTAAGREAEVVGMVADPWLAVTLGLAQAVVEFDDILAEEAPELTVRELVAESSFCLVAGRQSRVLRSAMLTTLIAGLREAQGET